MESGLEDRNNQEVDMEHVETWDVSMESGLEDRNNDVSPADTETTRSSQWSPA